MAKQILVSGEAEKALQRLMERMRKAHEDLDSYARLHMDKDVKAIITESLLLWAERQKMQFMIDGDQLMVGIPSLTTHFTIKQ